jgi:hypothetical protein
LAVLAELKSERLRVGGEGAQGLKKIKMLACAHSNIATDNLLEGLVNLGVSAVRLGRPTNVRSMLWNHTLDGRLQKEPEWVSAKAALDQAFADSKDSIVFDAPDRNTDMVEGGDAATPKRTSSTIGEAKKALQRAEAACITRILTSAEVIVCSTIGAGRLLG